MLTDDTKSLADDAIKTLGSVSGAAKADAEAAKKRKKERQKAIEAAEHAMRVIKNGAADDDKDDDHIIVQNDPKAVVSHDEPADDEPKAKKAKDKSADAGKPKQDKSKAKAKDKSKKGKKKQPELPPNHVPWYRRNKAAKGKNRNPRNPLDWGWANLFFAFLAGLVGLFVVLILGSPDAKEHSVQWIVNVLWYVGIPGLSFYGVGLLLSLLSDE